MIKIKLAYQRLRQKEYHIRFLLVTILVILFFPKAFSQQRTSVSSSKANRPNIVIIMADDLDSRQLSCYGGENLRTTHIDRLAQEGLKFNNLIASEAMCVPTRASLFTGLYPLRHGAYQNHKPVYPDVKSVAHYLQELGYRVGLTGKDHVTKPKSSFPFQLVPGFEKNCVATTDEYFLDSIADFIQSTKDPYCLFVMSVNPHAPWTVGDTAEFDKAKLKLPAHWVDTDLTRRQFVKYLAEVRRLDNQVGDVQLLEANKQLENTIVIFLGEQGPQFPGGKWTLYDNGQRSAMLIRWPGKVAEHTSTDAIVQYEDITPTLVAIAGGVPLKSLDGRSFLPVIKDSQNTFREYAFGIHNNIPEGPAYPIRSIRNNRFKLIVNLNSDQMYRIKYMTDTANRQQVYTSWVRKGENDETARRLAQRIVKHPPVEFYDLQQDPNELHDLSGNESYFTAIDEMRKELFKWMEAQGDTGAGLDVPIKRHKQ